jgi:hypothetical protein
MVGMLRRKNYIWKVSKDIHLYFALLTKILYIEINKSYIGYYKK